MIDDIVILPIRREHAIMPRPGTDILIPLEDLSRSRTEGTRWRRPSHIADAVGVITPSALLAHICYTGGGGIKGTHPPTLNRK